MSLFRNKSTTGWLLFDWANSVFSTTVMAGFFPVFFKEYWSAGVEPTVSTAYLGFANSISALVIAICLPIIGALTDVRPWKKEAVLLFTICGCAATAMLAFVGKGQYIEAALLYGVGAACFNGSCAIYDALLSSVAEGDDADFVSSLGYAFGYLGGGVLFTLNVLMYLHPDWFGLTDGVQGIRYSFLSVAGWWFFFSLPLFLWTQEAHTPGGDPSVRTALAESFATLKSTLRHVISEKPLLYFVIGYWLYIDGVYSVVKMAIDYGVAIGFQAKELIAALLLTQFVGFPAALIYSWIGKKIGAKRAILLGLGGYAIIVFWACIMTKPWEFFALAVFIGLVQGGVQALSRSLFLRLVPADKTGEYFGLLNLVGKFASIAGPALVAIVAMVTQNSRASIGSLLILFIFGAYFLNRVELENNSRRI